MAKQKSIRSTFDDEFSIDFEGKLDDTVEGDLEIEETNGELAQQEEVAAPVVALSPEAALESLLLLGRSQGYVSYDDVLKVMPEAENSMEQLEDIFASLFEQGIDVGQTRDDDQDILGDISDAEIETVEIEEEEFDLSQIEIDDSISLYLKAVSYTHLTLPTICSV